MPRDLVDVAAKISEATGYDLLWVLTGNQKAPDPEGAGAVEMARSEGFEPPTF